ncbi:MAG: ABC transporter ATP-binding protein [Phycisphaerae bacterium]|nr:ABC transporter ATP-binding protein [Phycisphaerae bacterium]MDD5381918.1 ABC transporter ATP-binding protein [Phycisphaerae bacterium]
MADKSKLLEVKGLCVDFFTERGVAHAVQNVSFSIKEGQTFALVGESGCGKSVTALSIMRLVPSPPGTIVAGEIVFGNRNLFELGEKRMRAIRGNKIAMIFQEPMTSLNPVYTVGDQIVEAIELHQKKNANQAWADAVEMLQKVGIADPQQRVHEYPHQMSGGMRQRVMIAMAISCKPALLIADEPTTALDVTIQAQILDLLDELQERSGMSILLITHNLGVVAERADDVAVMYASRIAEAADSQKLFSEPLHPYTQGLLKSLPRLGYSAKRLQTIPGTVPDPLHFPSGCKFHPRCPIGNTDRRCQTVEPLLREVQGCRCVACWYAPGYETGEEYKEYESKYGKHKRLSA